MVHLNPIPESPPAIGKTPVRIILWCPITKMLIKACFLIQPLEQEGVYQKSCISLCSKVFINHFYRMKASPECLNILSYWSKYLVDRLRRTLRRKVLTGIFYNQICRICHYILHQVAHIDCSAPSGKQHEPLNGVCVIETPTHRLTEWSKMGFLEYPYKLVSLYHSYRQTSNIRHTKSQNLKHYSFRLAVQFAQSIDARC